MPTNCLLKSRGNFTPDRRKNEADYWAVRDQLLDQYRGQWIGFAEGRVIASGTSPVTVFHAAEATGLHPFFICVGREEEPCRIRHAALARMTCETAEVRLVQIGAAEDDEVHNAAWRGLRCSKRARTPAAAGKV